MTWNPFGKVAEWTSARELQISSPAGDWNILGGSSFSGFSKEGWILGEMDVVSRERAGVRMSHQCGYDNVVHTVLDCSGCPGVSKIRKAVLLAEFLFDGGESTVYSVWGPRPAAGVSEYRSVWIFQIESLGDGKRSVVKVDDSRLTLHFFFGLREEPPSVGQVNVSCLDDEGFLGSAAGLSGNVEQVANSSSRVTLSMS